MHSMDRHFESASSYCTASQMCCHDSTVCIWAAKQTHTQPHPQTHTHTHTNTHSHSDTHIHIHTYIRTQTHTQTHTHTHPEVPISHMWVVVPRISAISGLLAVDLDDTAILDVSWVLQLIEDVACLIFDEQCCAGAPEIRTCQEASITFFHISINWNNYFSQSESKSIPPWGYILGERCLFPEPSSVHDHADHRLSGEYTVYGKYKLLSKSNHCCIFYKTVYARWLTSEIVPEQRYLAYWHLSLVILQRLLSKITYKLCLL